MARPVALATLLLLLLAPSPAAFSPIQGSRATLRAQKRQPTTLVRPAARRGGGRFESFVDELQRAPSVGALHGVLEAMRRKGAEPETLHFNAALARANQLRAPANEALRFFEDCCAAGGSGGAGNSPLAGPDAFTYSSAIKAVGADWRKALALLEDMPRRGVEPVKL